MSKIIKFVAKRAWELAANNTGPIVTFVGGAGMTYYLASVTAWAHAAGPLGWWLIAIAVMFAASLGYFIFSKASLNRSIEAFAKRKIETGKVNVLAPIHEHERINVVEFYSPYLRPFENVRFSDCELLGPATVFMDGGGWDGVEFIECEVVLVNPLKRIKGVTVFKNPLILRGKAIRLTLLMSADTYHRLPADIKPGLPVISDGQAGNL